MFNSFPFYQQLDSKDCGPSCIRMIAKYYGRTLQIGELRAKSYLSRQGVSLLGISDASESFGFRSLGVKINFNQLKEAPLPCIVHWNQNHFVVVHKIKKDEVHIADPAAGLFVMKRREFEQFWLAIKSTNHSKFNQEGPLLSSQETKSDLTSLAGIALLLEPTANFYSLNQNDSLNKQSELRHLLRYTLPFRKYFFQLFLALLLGSVIQLIFPLLTQSIVDIGINTHNLNFIYLVLIGQLMLNISRAMVDFIRGWILVHLSVRINVAILSDFLVKMMRLPLSFFEHKMTGDLLKRIEDHSRVERFISSSSLSLLFSFFNVLVFGLVLLMYNVPIFFTVSIASFLYVGFIHLFMAKRRELDYKKFNRMSQNQNMLIQVVQGIHEIKLNNIEREKRWAWEHMQAILFKLNTKTLQLQQWQDAGSLLINETKNLVITVMAARAVLAGELTIGMMLSVQYIIGQMNGPINQFVNFLREYQDARLSLERIGEVHSLDSEDEGLVENDATQDHDKNSDINISNLSFQYSGPHSAKVLDEISLHIPHGKITAIVGGSGSGKTTLLKLLLKFYLPVSGSIKVNEFDLSKMHAAEWRKKCGVVMQDGFIFADTIAANVAFVNEPDISRLLAALQTANILNFIRSLPLGINTMIGGAGTGLSEGQKQRILIARAVYKDPRYLFFDEATSSLDANNEKIIMQNLNDFYKGRTVVVVAHRLSTVKNADQIIVLDQGKIKESGTHKELISKQGQYFELVKNQLELGN